LIRSALLVEERLNFILNEFLKPVFFNLLNFVVIAGVLNRLCYFLIDFVRSFYTEKKDGYTELYISKDIEGIIFSLLLITSFGILLEILRRIIKLDWEIMTGYYKVFNEQIEIDLNCPELDIDFLGCLNSLAKTPGIMNKIKKVLFYKMFIDKKLRFLNLIRMLFLGIWVVVTVSTSLSLLSFQSENEDLIGHLFASSSFFDSVMANISIFLYLSFVVIVLMEIISLIHASIGVIIFCLNIFFIFRFNFNYMETALSYIGSGYFVDYIGIAPFLWYIPIAILISKIVTIFLPSKIDLVDKINGIANNIIYID
jgi:hypothetical protein